MAEIGMLQKLIGRLGGKPSLQMCSSLILLR
jgi:hypothetical protein